MEVTRFDFALAQLRVNPAKVKSFPVSEHPSTTRLRSILTNFIASLDLHEGGIIFRLAVISHACTVTLETVVSSMTHDFFIG